MYQIFSNHTHTPLEKYVQDDVLAEENNFFSSKYLICGEGKSTLYIEYRE